MMRVMGLVTRILRCSDFESAYWQQERKSIKAKNGNGELRKPGFIGQSQRGISTRNTAGFEEGRAHRTPGLPFGKIQQSWFRMNLAYLAIDDLQPWRLAEKTSISTLPERQGTSRKFANV